MQLRRFAVLPVGTLLTPGVILGFLLLVSVGARAQTCGQSYLNSLPVPIPTPPSHRVVQLINCSNQVLLGATNAAVSGSSPGYPVFPREKTWVMQPYGAANNGNILTIDIPPKWESTGPIHSHGPNIWARTGCRYDIAANRAQCETGSCADQYDCSSAALSLGGRTTFTEWNFYQDYRPPLPQHFDSFDISAVNGTSLTVTIQAVGGDSTDPSGNHQNTFWWNRNKPMAVYGGDLRKAASCPSAFLLQRSDLMTDPNGAANIPGLVIMGPTGEPIDPDGTVDNASVACFSNCGKYEFPVAPAINCDEKTDSTCYRWKTFCAGDPSKYGSNFAPGTYPSLNDCINPANGTYNDNVCPVNGSCWNQQIPPPKPGKTVDGTCQLKGFISASSCSASVCTYPYGFTNPWNGQPVYSSQPPFGSCAYVAAHDPQFPNDPPDSVCIGDDRVHAVFPHAYTWPNDPQTYSHDAPVYRVIYAPGGTTVPITPASNSLPLCSALPDRYNYGANLTNCAINVNSQGAVFGIARLTKNDPSKGWISTGSDWSCAIDERGGNDTGVLCRWNQAPAGNCSPPKLDANVTQGACGLIDSGTSLVSTSMQPNSMDTLFAEVSIPNVLNPVVGFPQISGCASPWTAIAEKAISTNQGLVIWYTGKANTSSSCEVTVTLASQNPAALKVYDVPKAMGVETVSTDSGSFVYTQPNQPFPSVGAGAATTNNPKDLMLAALLQVNQQPTPATYWEFWLTNSSIWPGGIHCEPNDNFCPTNDGTDWLPGHGPNSSSADAGHQQVTNGPHRLQRPAQSLGSFVWGGVALYVKLQ